MEKQINDNKSEKGSTEPVLSFILYDLTNYYTFCYILKQRNLIVIIIVDYKNIYGIVSCGKAAKVAVVNRFKR